MRKEGGRQLILKIFLHQNIKPMQATQELSHIKIALRPTSKTPFSHKLIESEEYKLLKKIEPLPNK